MLGAVLSTLRFIILVLGGHYGWPKNLLHWAGIHESILDICATVRPHFVIADGIVAMDVEPNHAYSRGWSLPRQSQPFRNFAARLNGRCGARFSFRVPPQNDSIALRVLVNPYDFQASSTQLRCAWAGFATASAADEY